MESEPYAIDARRLHQRRRWVVSGPNLGRFGPRRGHRRGMAERERSRATPSTRSRRLLRPETTAMPSSCSRERPRVVDATPSSRSKASRSTTQEDEPEPIKPEPKKSRKRKKREDQPPPRRKFRVKALEAERPASTSNARVDVTTAGLRVGADRPRDIPNAPAAPAPASVPPPVVLDEEAFRSSTRLDLSLIHISEPTRPY